MRQSRHAIGPDKAFPIREFAITYTQTSWEDEEYDEPKVIVDEAIKAQNNLLCGFYGNDKANKKKLKEMRNPNNAAISLAGEPTLYPKIDELIGEFNRRDFTTFVVSNGQCVERLRNLENDPYQLYLSLDAPSQKIFNDVCRPRINDAWNNLNESYPVLTHAHAYEIHAFAEKIWKTLKVMRN